MTSCPRVALAEALASSFLWFLLRSRENVGTGTRVPGLHLPSLEDRGSLGTTEGLFLTSSLWQEEGETGAGWAVRTPVCQRDAQPCSGTPSDLSNLLCHSSDMGAAVVFVSQMGHGEVVTSQGHTAKWQSCIQTPASRPCSFQAQTLSLSSSVTLDRLFNPSEICFLISERGMRTTFLPFKVG